MPRKEKQVAIKQYHVYQSLILQQHQDVGYTHSYFFPDLLTIHLWIRLGVAPHFSSTDHTDKIKCALLWLLFHVLIFKLTVPVMNLGHRVLEPNHGHSSALACPSWHASQLCSHGNLQWPKVFWTPWPNLENKDLRSPASLTWSAFSSTFYREWNWFKYIFWLPKAGTWHSSTSSSHPLCPQDWPYTVGLQ